MKFEIHRQLLGNCKMWKIISLVLVPLAIANNVEKAGGSWNDEAPLNIQGGKIKDIIKRPYMVSIIAFKKRLVCSGSIIGPKTVLTASHCLNAYPFTSLTIRAGSNTWRKGGTLHDIDGKVSPRDKNSDILILKVQQAFEFVNQIIKPIRLVDATYKPLPGVLGSVNGWGFTDAHDTCESEFLRSVKLPIIKTSICDKTRDATAEPVHKDEFCASYMKKNRQEGFCSGDSGGPFVVEGKLVGIATRRLGLFERSYTAGQTFTSVSYHRNWIREKTGI